MQDKKNEPSYTVKIGGILAALKNEAGLTYSKLIQRILKPGFSAFKIQSFQKMTGTGPEVFENYTIEGFDETIKRTLMDSFPLQDSEKGNQQGTDYTYREYMQLICKCAVKLDVTYETVCNYTPLVLDSMLSAMNEHEKDDQYKTAVAAIQNRIAANKEHLRLDDLIIIP